MSGQELLMWECFAVPVGIVIAVFVMWLLR
jgi:hypothetical protein